MPSYLNERCPVCQKPFQENEDIVTCPQCGTPHHRACYAALGHCANVQKHGTDFAYTPAEDAAPQAEDAAAKSSPVGETKRCIRCRTEIEKDAPFCSQCGQRQPSENGKEPHTPFGAAPSVAEAFVTGYEQETQTLDGQRIADIADVVRTNARRFIPKFIENKKLSWNWGALVFGPYYLLFRKMYKEGILALAVRLIISLIAQGIYAEPFAAFSRFISANYNAISTGEINDELLTQMTAYSNALLPMFAIILAGNAVLHIVLALFADRFYRSKVFALLTKVEEKLDAGEMFEQNLLFGMDEAPLSQADMKRLYLSKIGGTSLFAPMIAFFVYDLITSILSNL